MGKKIHKLYKERLNQFSSNGQYRTVNLQSMMYEGTAEGAEHIKLTVWDAPGQSRPTFKDATKASNDYRKTQVGESFGPSWTTHWFRVLLSVPEQLRKKERLEFHWDANNEGMVWSGDGLPLQGLTGGGERVEWIIPEDFRDGGQHMFYVEMACNGMFGCANGDLIQPPNPENYYSLSCAKIVAVNVEARALFVDFWILGDAAREFPEDSWEEHTALTLCNDIMETFQRGDPGSILRCRKMAQAYLGKYVDSTKVYDSKMESAVYAISYCHIDTCWLWPWAETKRKVARSWTNQCNLMEQYPEHRFTCTQPQQYKWLKENYPHVWDRVKTQVKKGNFQPMGGSWVEHDTNLPGGESLVRQFLYGQRFFESHFGERCQTFFLPDTFGYSSQIPQLCRLAGMSRFLTQKLSWNNINNFPHTTFNWVALDGTQVLCHMPPCETYTAEAHFGDVKRSVEQHKSMDQDHTSLLVFGKGDGGGGATWQMLEKLRRCRGISDTIGRLPRVKMGDSVDDFFLQLEEKAEKKGVDFVTWYGELYFELHRGTYTTQAFMKRNNRKGEVLLHDIEHFATLATLQHLVAGGSKKGTYVYPKQELDTMWEIMLLCQFHDCLPGSCIEMCYDDSREIYDKFWALGAKVLDTALQALGLDDPDAPNHEQPNKSPGLSVFGTASLWRSPDSSTSPILDPIRGLLQPKQPWKSRLSVRETEDGVFEMSNSELTVQVQHGVIRSLYDHVANREILPAGSKANQLVIFDDKPLYWQAWDVEVYHLDSRTGLHGGETVIETQSPAMITLLTTTLIGAESWVKSRITLRNPIEELSEKGTSSSMIEVDCEIEWQEAMRFLKVEFPVDITNTEASYETQFGINRRPTHYNTTWDMAKFEVCCHRFADLSEATYGVSIVNDCKYGFAVQGNVMRLSLLRAPKAPDGHADMGRHRVRYGIYPHRGPLGIETVRLARAFNGEKYIRKITDRGLKILPKLMNSFTVTDADNLILDTVKRAEDDSDIPDSPSFCEGLAKRDCQSVILRIYDSLGGKSRGKIVSKLPVKRGWKCSLLEDNLQELILDSSSSTGPDHKPTTWNFTIELRAFEIASYRLELGE